MSHSARLKLAKRVRRAFLRGIDGKANADRPHASTISLHRVERAPS